MTAASGAGRLERRDGQRDAGPPAHARHAGGDGVDARHAPGWLAADGGWRLASGPGRLRAALAASRVLGVALHRAVADGCQLRPRGRPVAAAARRAGGDAAHRTARRRREHRLPPGLHGQRGGGGTLGAPALATQAYVQQLNHWCCCSAWPSGLAVEVVVGHLSAPVACTTRTGWCGARWRSGWRSAWAWPRGGAGRPWLLRLFTQDAGILAAGATLLWWTVLLEPGAPSTWW
jgi:hypothetical protein